jgi:rare lipoprotein A (peptidoglycan hydrolase)
VTGRVTNVTRPSRGAKSERMRYLAFLGLCACAMSCRDPNAGFRPPVTPSSTHAQASQGEGDREFTKEASAPKGVDPDQAGLATWYGGAFAGKKTANGERFDPAKYTAAHRKLKFGTWVEVRRTDTGRTVRVRINDRGPFGDDRRIIDLSKKAAEDLDIIHEGVSKVELRVVGGP